MLSSKSVLLSLLLFSLSLHVAICTNPLYHYCFGPKNFTANSPYRINLNNLLKTLPTKVSSTGFARGSSGQGQSRVYGIALCRGDVSKTNCVTCVNDAIKKLRQQCPKQKGAIIWYDNCMFKYSDADFFGKIDNKNKFYMYNVKGVDNPTSFNKKVKELLSSLASIASANQKWYVAGKLESDGSKTLYGIGQCSRDLSNANCKKCLDSAISELPSRCSGKRGARVVGGSCNVRYELYSFVN
ncbi:hypothetical protein Pint_02082 [Pistacia integerrima]|uniref:Uncharacterized protein n=1 Tax=Pistacia integerrima TaxID=434235 RepID=A0ACC0ZI01_9ROSI|nr:hypothetical protein Pint_02082 [Pistacia integerrima]